MIRRDLPRGSEPPSHWLLISQIEHARVSHQLATAWKSNIVSWHVREEFLAAVLHHDDGWDDWQTAPRIDPEHGRPYGFTEMPPSLAQEIWSKSIDVCRAIGPLAGWIVASHFIQLQGKQDDDFAEWARWLGEQDRRRTEWLAEWRATDPVANTPAVADRCLFLLQVFDWLSLWLCCRAPVDERDPGESLDLGDPAQGFGPFALKPGETPGELLVSPWPFVDGKMEVVVNSQQVAAGHYLTPSDWKSAPRRVTWRLLPGT